MSDRASFYRSHYGTFLRDSRPDYPSSFFENAAIANDNFDSSAIIKQLYPDQETYKKEEQRRFEILDAHWDLPIKDVDPDAR